MRLLTFLFFTTLLCPAQSPSRGEVERVYQAVRTATETTKMKPAAVVVWVSTSATSGPLPGPIGN